MTSRALPISLIDLIFICGGFKEEVRHVLVARETCYDNFKNLIV
jgi:hypothetical protein